MIELLSSTQLAQDLAELQAAQTAILAEQGTIPGLAIVEGVGETRLGHEVSAYVRGKIQYLTSVGIRATHASVLPLELHQTVEVYNDDPSLHGIIVEQPVPRYASVDDDRHHTWVASLLDRLHPAKAVDAQGASARYTIGATAEAQVKLLDSHGHDGVGKHVLIVGVGNVGIGSHTIYAQRAVKDLSAVDLNLNNVDQLPRLARAADLIVVATGREHTLLPEHIRDGHVIAGIGARDIHPHVYELAGRDFAITPQIGGVGPVTIRTLAGRVIEQAQEFAEATAA